MRVFRWAAGILAVLSLCCGAAQAEQVVEAWRSPFGSTWSASLRPSDGSLWIGTGTNVLHLSREGQILAECRGFTTPCSVSVNPVDGSCWVADRNGGRVARLAETGATLWESFSYVNPSAVAVDSSDGSCWVGSPGEWDSSAGTYTGGFVAHLSAEGALLWRGGEFGWPAQLATYSRDGSVWIADDGRWDAVSETVVGSAVIHLNADGSEAWRSGSMVLAESVSVNQADGSCWVAELGTGFPDYTDSRAIHFAADGAELWRGAFSRARAVSVDQHDGSCWVLEYGDYIPQRSHLIHLASDGAELWHSGDYFLCMTVAADPGDGSCWIGGTQTSHISGTGQLLYDADATGRIWSVSVNTADGSCWAADADRGRIIHIAANHSQLWHGGSYTFVTGVAADPADGSCWVADYMGDQVAHVSARGQELWRGTGWDGATTVAVNPSDGSCWVGGFNRVQHLAQGGSVLATLVGFSYCPSVAVNIADGSCWLVADTEVRHVAANGTELCRAGGFDGAWGIAVNSSDGSCWVADRGSYDESAMAYVSSVTHLAADGTQLWRGGDFSGAEWVAVNPDDGSCWAGDLASVVHLSADGEELSRRWGFYEVESVSVDPRDGSCWVADSSNSQVVHLMIMYSDVPEGSWAFDQIAACMSAGIVQGYSDGSYHPGESVNRAQMAVYMARALAGGDMAIPTAPAEATFSDVPSDHWAYRHVEYVAGVDVVQGYADGGYHPDEIVNRGQMAVYIARAVATPTGDAGVPEVPAGATPRFPDVTGENEWAWCYKYVEYCAAAGVVQGYQDGYYPEQEVTRDQMAVYVARAFELPVQGRARRAAQTGPGAPWAAARLQLRVADGPPVRVA